MKNLLKIITSHEGKVFGIQFIEAKPIDLKLNFFIDSRETPLKISKFSIGSSS